MGDPRFPLGGSSPPRVDHLYLPFWGISIHVPYLHLLLLCRPLCCLSALYHLLAILSSSRGFLLLRPPIPPLPPPSLPPPLMSLPPHLLTPLVGQV